MIKSVNLEIINICNLRCKMCDIWTNKNKHILSIRNIKNIFHSKYIDKNTDITITGGEPLLYKGIERIFLEISALGFNVNTISTNGTLYESLRELLLFLRQNNLNFPNIHISLDGDENAHDKQRGVHGSFKKSIEAIIKLKKEFHFLRIKLKYTITKDNIYTIDFVYDLSKKIGVDIGYKIIENDINYTNGHVKAKLLSTAEKDIIIDILSRIHGNESEYIKNLIFYMKNHELDFKCTTPKDNIFIMANGEVFPCTKKNSIGNIKKSRIDSLLFNDKQNEIIKKIDINPCHECFSFHGSYKTKM